MPDDHVCTPVVQADLHVIEQIGEAIIGPEVTQRNIETFVRFKRRLHAPDVLRRARIAMEHSLTSLVHIVSGQGDDCTLLQEARQEARGLVRKNYISVGNDKRCSRR